MNYHYLFYVKEGSSSEEALVELSFLLSDLYEVDDPVTGKVQIGGYAKKQLEKRTFDHAILEKAAPIEEVDWQQQWKSFSSSFRDGLAHIELEAFGRPILLLKPGGGFGDFSHPTTQLALKLMAPLVRDKILFDVGCGSGILSIAAVLLGAKKAYGIDIHQEAMMHSRENAAVNQLEEKAKFSTMLDPSWITLESCVIVMNMITTEQRAAWEALPLLHSQPAQIITSGILTPQKKDYLHLIKGWGWILKKEAALEGWSGFVFEQNLKKTKKTVQKK